VSRALRAALAAVTFLTIVPVGRGVELDAEDVGRAGPLFPLVGAAIGAIMGATAWELAKHVDATVAAAVAVAVGALVTGALHLDALADTADGLGGHTREDALRIMRDHHLGSFGVVALVLDLLIKTAAVAGLAARHSPVDALIAAGALSRAVPSPLAAALPYAQPSPGKGGAIGQRTSAGQALVAVLLAMAIAGLALHGNALPAAITAAVVVLLAAVFARRLGGITGDVLGAACETCETAVLVVLAAVV
jgi:cobalamin 5'-phosphate synthase/cobalamin synthase